MLNLLRKIKSEAAALPLPNADVLPALEKAPSAANGASTSRAVVSPLPLSSDHLRTLSLNPAAFPPVPSFPGPMLISTGSQALSYTDLFSATIPQPPAMPILSQPLSLLPLSQLPLGPMVPLISQPLGLLPSQPRHHDLQERKEDATNEMVVEGDLPQVKAIYDDYKARAGLKMAIRHREQGRFQ